MLPRRPAAKVVPRHNNLRLAPLALVQDEVRVLLLRLWVVPQLVERRDAEARTLDGFQKLLGDDHVRVDVLDVELGAHALEGREFGHACAAGDVPGLLLPRGLPRGDGEEVVLGIRDLARVRALWEELAHVDEVARDGGGGGHGGRAEVGSAPGALPALKVSVACAGAPLSRQQLVWIHGEAHGAPGLAPVKASLLQDHVQALRLRLLLHQPAPGHHHRVHAVRHFFCPWQPSPPASRPPPWRSCMTR
mmetsp:Transcript_35065/g.75985  ORF Transcript_35065/g.75985 Transcript_35065/m.75985 type:complete len:248 (-) Transcript_35065:29-772(-)